MAVFKKNDAWWIDYSFQGKRYRQKISSRRKVAEEALNRVKVKIAAGEFILSNEQQKVLQPSVLFKHFVERSFMPWSETEHSAGHHKRLRSIVKVHLVPHFGDCNLHEIAPKLIEDYKSLRRRARYKKGKGKKAKPVNVATVNRELCCLKTIFRKAVDWEMVDENPTVTVNTLKETPKKQRLLEEKEVAYLLDALPDHLKALGACAVYAGLRRSEIFHLRREDVNMKTGELLVVSREEHHTKNYETRQIPMSEQLKEALRRHPRRLGSPYLFCNRQGEPYDNVRKALNKAAQKAGIKGGITLHQLRHAFCSHAQMSGIDARTVQKWMGHKDLKTTLRYAHVSPDHEKAAICRLQYVGERIRHYLTPKLDVQKNSHLACAS